jgi:hypothetical protein
VNLFDAGEFMKQLKTFTLIFVAVLFLIGMVRFFSEDKINAKKSTRLLLRDFKSRDDTSVYVSRYENGDLRNKIDLRGSTSFLKAFSGILARYVSSSKALENNKCTYLDYVRVELSNKNTKCTIDFPVEGRPYEVAVFKFTNRPDGGIFALTRRGRDKIKLLLE